MSQSWQLFAFEVGIISRKKEAFQALCVAKNMAWNPLTFSADEFHESVDRGDNALMKQQFKQFPRSVPSMDFRQGVMTHFPDSVRGFVKRPIQKQEADFPI